MLQRSDSIKQCFKRSFKILFVTLTSLILAFFPGALIVAADSEDTPRPGIDKANEKNNVKPGGSNNHSNTEFDWEEIQGGSPGSGGDGEKEDRKSTRLNSSHVSISYAVFCLKKKI